MEPVVRLAGRLASEQHGAPHRGTAAGRRPRCPGVVPRQPVWARCSALYARGSVAILVYVTGREAAHGKLVEAQPDGTLCSGVDAASERQVRRGAMAGGVASS